MKDKLYERNEFIMEEKEKSEVKVENQATKKEAKKVEKKEVKKEVKKETPKKTTAKKQPVKKAEANTNLKNATKTNTKSAAKTEKKEEIKQDLKEVNTEETPKQDDLTFKKVENVNMKKEKLEKKEKKEGPGHKVAKFILVIIAILICAYVVFVTRNSLILKDIKKKVSEYKDITNYSYSVKAINGEIETEYTLTKKDKIERADINNITNPNANMIIYKDFNNNEGIVVFKSQNKAIKSLADKTSTFMSEMPFEYAYIDDTINGIMLYAWIYTENVNGKDCYVIQLDKDLKTWVEKDTGLVVKEQWGENNFTEITKIELNNVEEIYKPDLTGYEVSTQE